MIESAVLTRARMASPPNLELNHIMAFSQGAERSNLSQVARWRSGPSTSFLRRVKPTVADRPTQTKRKPGRSDARAKEVVGVLSSPKKIGAAEPAKRVNDCSS